MPDTDTNGHGPVDADAALVASLAERVDALQAQRDELQAQMDEITPHLQRYKKAIAALVPQPPRPEGEGPAPGTKTRRRRGPGAAGVFDEHGTFRKHGTSMAADRLAHIEAVVRDIAAERDDITQVEVRARTGDGSGTTAVAFEALRQKNVIRLVRQEGNLKVFRLTREAMAQTAS